MRRPSVLLAVAMLIAGCGSGPGTSGPASRPKLGISNGTTLAVSLVVNGRTVVTAPPGGPGPTVDVAALPDLPWTVEARSPSGRVLTSMRVQAVVVWTTARPGGAVESSGAYARVDLSCGSLRIWAGDVLPSGPFPGSGAPGDCEP
jgi:hypothetical protein